MYAIGSSSMVACFGRVDLDYRYVGEDNLDLYIDIGIENHCSVGHVS